MTAFVRRIAISVLLMSATLGSMGWQNAFADQALPPVPQTYVLDEPKVLSPQTRSVLSQLFQAQDQATGEQIVFALFNSLQGQDLVSWTNRVFQAWKIGKKGKDNGVLLALYWKEHQARLEVGYGQEPVLTDAKSKRILAEILVPKLKAGLTDQALIDTALEILRTLKSPLFENGEAEKILKGVRRSAYRPATPVAEGPIAIWFILGMILIILFARAFLMSPERNFRRNTWRPNTSFPFRRRRDSKQDDHDDPWGGFGGWGGPSGGGSSSDGDGGFSGGGGRSGGGGASEKW